MDASVGSCASCGKSVRLADVLYTADARLVCPICFTKADVIAGRQRAVFDGWSAALIGAIANVIPFLVHAVASVMITVQGAAGPSAHGWVELGSGAGAVICGGATIIAARSRASAGWLAIGVLIALLGAYHAVHGARLS